MNPIYITITILLVLTSCATSPKDTSAQNSNNTADAIHLLQDLSKKNSEVDKLMLVKSPGKDVEQLASRIADAFLALQKEIERMHISIPENSPLPPAEIQTRQEIQSTQTKRLLGSESETFRTNFLLTQLSALDYASHLIEYILTEPPAESGFDTLKKHQTELDDLYEITRKIISEK